MNTQTLQAEVRPLSGKGPARQLRLRGLIPAVLYGPGIETTSISVSPKELQKALSTGRGRNALLRVRFGEREELALARDVAVHPVTRQPLHVDFYRVDLNREVHVDVPFHTVGRAPGVQQGGTLHVVFHSLPIAARPDQIPTVIEADVSGLQLNDGLSGANLALPEGVRLRLDPSQTLVVVVAEKKAEPEPTAAAPAATEATAAAAPAKPAGTK